MDSDSGSGWAIIVSAMLLACGETSRMQQPADVTATSSRGEGGTVVTTLMSGVGTTRLGASSTTLGAGGSGTSVSVSSSAGGTMGGDGTGGAESVSCTCGELEGTCTYPLQSFCFGLDCSDPGLLATQHAAAAFCDGDAAQTMSYCEDGTYRFERSWGAGENDAFLVFSRETDDLVYGAAFGYLDTPCGDEGMDVHAGTAPTETSCQSCVICKYGEELAEDGTVLAGNAGAAGAGGQSGRCLWSGEGVPLIP